MKSGDQSLNCSGNIPSHNTGGNLAFHNFVNQPFLNGEIGFLDPSFRKQFQTGNVIIGKFGSLSKYFFSPVDIILQLQRELLQTVESLTRVEFGAPCPGMKEKGRAGGGGAAIRSQDEGNGRALYDSGCVNFDRIGQTPDQII
jgi:hypothetical protein